MSGYALHAWWEHFSYIRVVKCAVWAWTLRHDSFFGRWHVPFANRISPLDATKWTLLTRERLHSCALVKQRRTGCLLQRLRRAAECSQCRGHCGGQKRGAAAVVERVYRQGLGYQEPLCSRQTRRARHHNHAAAHLQPGRHADLPCWP